MPTPMSGIRAAGDRGGPSSRSRPPFAFCHRASAPGKLFAMGSKLRTGSKSVRFHEPDGLGGAGLAIHAGRPPIRPRAVRRIRSGERPEHRVRSRRRPRPTETKSHPRSGLAELECEPRMLLRAVFQAPGARFLGGDVVDAGGKARTNSAGIEELRGPLWLGSKVQAELRFRLPIASSGLAGWSRSRTRSRSECTSSAEGATPLPAGKTVHDRVESAGKVPPVTPLFRSRPKSFGGEGVEACPPGRWTR